MRGGEPKVPYFVLPGIEFCQHQDNDGGAISPEMGEYLADVVTTEVVPENRTVG